MPPRALDSFPGKLEDRRTVDVECADSLVFEPSGRFLGRDTCHFVPAA